ncbi:MAG: AAA family ATPase [Desulfovibrionaceae bacterium]|nr:AAA family ATPase [Desulfovibrionaceae bacterium]
MSNINFSDIKYLSYGNPEFTYLREENKIYVDKTGLIYKIASQDTPIFFSRPRRFGKSLLINTLQALFSTGLEYFHGLEIEKVWNDKTYKVVHIDFSGMADDDHIDLIKDLGEIIIQEFEMDDLVSRSNSSGLKNPSMILNEICKKLKNKSVVLLIDEYDAPLTHNINNHDELDRIKKVLNNFYAVIKQYTGKFRLIFITGVTRASHISNFSAFNNLLDLSLDPEFNSLLGFTKENLERYFDPYVETAAQILKMRKKDVYQRLEQYYDGFQFCLNATGTVYSPWSILRFFRTSKEGFQNYWFQSSGSSTIIMQYLKKSAFFNSLNNYDHEILVTTRQLSDSHEITDIPADILLFQSGYLTLRKQSYDLARLVFPNIEVEDSILNLYLLAHNLRPEIKFATKIQNLVKNIDEKNLESIVDTFNAILNDCVSILSKIFDDERSVRDIIYAAIPQNISLQKIKERETARGKSDLELLTANTRLVIEFKRANSRNDARSALEKAIAQIESKNYGVDYFQDYTLYRVGMVICADEKKILYEYCQEL